MDVSCVLREQIQPGARPQQEQAASAQAAPWKAAGGASGRRVCRLSGRHLRGDTRQTVLGSCWLLIDGSCLCVTAAPQPSAGLGPSSM